MHLAPEIRSELIRKWEVLASWIVGCSGIQNQKLYLEEKKTWVNQEVPHKV